MFRSELRSRLRISLRLSLLLIVGLFVSCGSIPVPSMSEQPLLTQALQQTLQQTSSINSEDSLLNNHFENTGTQFTTSQAGAQGLAIELSQPQLSNASLNNASLNNEIEVVDENAIVMNQKMVLNPLTGKIANSQILSEAITAKNYYRSGKYQQAIDLYDILRRENHDVQEYSDMLFKCYSAYASDLMANAELDHAQKILNEALLLKPDDLSIIAKLNELQRTGEANQYYADGIDALNKELSEKAIVSFAKVLYINPMHSQAQLQMSLLKDRYLTTYYKQAMVHFRKRELDQAITKWGRVLILEPGHQMAKAYLARAAALKYQFDKL